MLYQANGKTIYLSLEEYLSLSDDELKWLANSHPGDKIQSTMLYGKHSIKEPDPLPVLDIDYEFEVDDNQSDKSVCIDDLIEDLPDDIIEE